MKRHATAVWNGSGKEGSGDLTTQSTTLNKTQYSFNSRFAEGVGTNPEELIAAAHAGCFAMKLSFVLGGAGFTPESLEATAYINLDPALGAITESHIVLKAKVPGIDQAKFDECVKDAETNCPVSKVLNAKISVEAELIG
ncbi:MAG TPA: OsmC family protein [Chitinophagaceae bacterium]|nr:OsmC family protein [Chitinophagaceae bacterium]